MSNYAWLYCPKCDKSSESESINRGHETLEYLLRCIPDIQTFYKAIEAKAPQGYHNDLYVEIEYRGTEFVSFALEHYEHGVRVESEY